MNINSREVILYACRNLSITKPSKNVYNISINKNLKYKGKSISSWIKLITYGNRDIKGYPVVLNIFRKVKDNISYIYREYKLKWPYDITTNH